MGIGKEEFVLFPEDDDNENEYADFDQQLIARHPIIQAVHTSVAEETLEKSGPRKKRPQVNGDNTVLFHLSKYVFGKTSWWTHARPAEKNKDGLWSSAFCHRTWRVATPRTS